MIFGDLVRSVVRQPRRLRKKIIVYIGQTSPSSRRGVAVYKWCVSLLCIKPISPEIKFSENGDNFRSSNSIQNPSTSIDIDIEFQGGVVNVKKLLGHSVRSYG